MVAPTPAELAAAAQDAASRNQGDSQERNGAPSNQTTSEAGNQTTSETQPPTDQPTADSALDSLLPPPVEPSDPSSAPSPSHSLLSGGAGPVLFGLLALVILVLGIAVVPRRWRTSGGFTAVVSHHRLELGLIGATVLAVGLIGMLIALLSR